MRETVCPDCGASQSISDIEAGVCSECGARMRRAIGAPPAAPASSKKLAWLIIGFGSAICLLLVVVVGLLLKSGSSNQPTAKREPAWSPDDDLKIVAKPETPRKNDLNDAPATKTEGQTFAPTREEKRTPEFSSHFLAEQLATNGTGINIQRRGTENQIWLVAILKTPVTDKNLLTMLQFKSPNWYCQPTYAGVEMGRAVNGAFPELPTTDFVALNELKSRPANSVAFLIPRRDNTAVIRYLNGKDMGQNIAWASPVTGTSLVENRNKTTVTPNRVTPPRSATPKRSQVTAVDAPLAVRGEPWSLKLDPTDPGDTYRVAKGPTGLTVDVNGTAAWQVPPRYGGPEDVVIEVVNADSKRTMKFTLTAGKRTKDGVEAIERLPKMTDDQEYLPLDGRVARMIPVQDGRFAVCGIAEKKRLAVVDLVEIKEIASIEWPVLTDKSCGFAAGGERVVVYDRQKEMLNVYNLRTGVKENSFRNPLPQSLSDVVMGSAKDDAICCAATEGDGPECIIDIVTLPQGRRLNVGPGPTQLQRISRHPVRLIAGADLSIVTVSRIGVSPEGAILLMRAGNTYTFTYEHESPGLLYPLSGQELCGSRAMYGHDLKKKLEIGEKKSLQGLRPVMGSDLLLGLAHDKAFYFARNSAEPLREWAALPDKTAASSSRGFPRWLNRRPIECIGFSAIVGRGYILPGDAFGLLVVISDKTVAAPPSIASSGGFTVIAGAKWSEKIETLGSTKGLVWALERSPAGLSVSPDGTLSWDVPAEFRGTLECDLSVKGTDGSDRRKLVFSASVCSLADSKTWKSGSGILVLDSKETLAAGAPGSTYAAVTHGTELFSLDAKTLRPIQQAALPEAAVQLQLRGDDAIVITPKQLIVYSLPSLKQRTSVKLLCDKITDVAVHPSQRICWIAARDPEFGDGFRSRRILQVNESTGKAAWLDGALGKLIAVSPDGKSLFVGIKEDFYDSTFVVDVFGQPYQLSQYASVDLLMRYSLFGTSAKPQQLQARPGENLRRIVISPDGKHVSPVAGGGFRAGSGTQNGYTIPSLQAGNLTVCDAAFNTDAYPQFIAYHPTLDLVAAGNEKQIRVFELKTGIARGPNIGAPEGMTALSNAFFSGDLTKVCVLGDHKQHGRVLIAIHLQLEDAEKRKANSVAAKSIAEAPASLDKSNAPPPTPAKPAVKVRLGQIAALQGASLMPMTPKDVAAKFNAAVVVISHAEGSGSGFLISDDGLIATCAHVLPRGNDPVKVQLENPPRKTTVEAVVVMRDDAQDLALLKATPGFTCKYVRFEPKKAAQMGEEVTIIGNPGLGNEILSNTMTQGIVSNPQRSIEGANFIQTTAAVNPGTSGSPLFNSFGNVIGLVTLKGNIEAAGFAVPAERVKSFLERCCEGVK